MNLKQVLTLVLVALIPMVGSAKKVKKDLKQQMVTEKMAEKKVVQTPVIEEPEPTITE